MIPIPFPFQFELVGRVRQTRMRGYRIIVIQAATGAGKTTIACYIVKGAVGKGSRVLFLVHRRRLVDQICGRLIDFEINHGVIMRGEKLSSSLVQVASRDTMLSRCVRNQWFDLPEADLVIVDEAHHAADPESEYRRILANYPQATILLLSATPVGTDGRGLGPWAEAIECAAPTSQLVQDGFLVPVKCFAPDRKKNRQGNYQRGIAGDLVESWKMYAEDMPTVLFCSRVQHSIDAVTAFNEAGISAAHVDADTSDINRDEIFAGLETGQYKVVSNVGIIGEGVDVPELGCCQLYCEVGGRVRFLQACGRIMRPHPGKTHGVLIDHSGAVFKHGFPDEDTQWTLEGNADAEFKSKHDENQTEQAHYCKTCERLYHGQMACPGCGKMPVKPPRSIFAPPPVHSTDEILTEAERANLLHVHSREEKIKHWLRCLGMAAARGATFGMAVAVWRQKYKDEWPDDGFPCRPDRSGWKQKVHEVYPNFKRKKSS